MSPSLQTPASREFPRFCALTLLICVGGCSAETLTSSASPGETQAWFEVDREREDFGEVYHGAVRRTDFELVAAGSDPLVVTALNRSCGCTEAELRVVEEDGSELPFELGRPYPPGTRFRLLASLNTLGREGVQEQRVYVITGGETLTSFALDATIVTFLEIEPAFLDPPDVSTLEGFAGEFRIRSRGGELFGIDARRDVLPDDLEVAFVPLDADGEGRSSNWRMDYRILPGATRGAYKRKVILMTDALNVEAEPFRDGSPAVHVGEVWIRAAIEGAFAVRPERLNLGRLIPGQTTRRRIVIDSRDPGFDLDGLQLVLLESGGGDFVHGDAFQITARPIQAGKTWEIEIETRGYPEPGPFSGILLVKLDHPFEPYVKVPLIGQAVVTAN